MQACGVTSSSASRVNEIADLPARTRKNPACLSMSSQLPSVSPDEESTEMWISFHRLGVSSAACLHFEQTCATVHGGCQESTGIRTGFDTESEKILERSSGGNSCTTEAAGVGGVIEVDGIGISTFECTDEKFRIPAPEMSGQKGMKKRKTIHFARPCCPCSPSLVIHANINHWHQLSDHGWEFMELSRS